MEKNPLTKRQVQILQLLANGCTQHEIARRLRVSVTTVRNHITRSAARLGASGSIQTVATALRLRLIE